MASSKATSKAILTAIPKATTSALLTSKVTTATPKVTEKTTTTAILSSTPPTSYQTHGPTATTLITQRRTEESVPTNTVTIGTWTLTISYTNDGTLIYDTDETIKPKQPTPLAQTNASKAAVPTQPIPPITTAQKNIRTTAASSIKPALMSAAAKRTYSPRKISNSNQRFFKPPPATQEWQKIVRPNRKNSAKVKNCFHCHKKGHIRRFC